MSNGKGILAVARLDLADVLRSRWLIFCLVIYALMASIFVLVGMRESSVMGFTGMGRVLLAFSHALVLLIPLLGLTATGQVINGAREDGSLELLFSHPVSRAQYFVAISLVRLTVLLLPLLILMPAMAIYGQLAFGQAVAWDFLMRALCVSASLMAVSVAAGLLVSTYVRNQAKALMLLLLIWAMGVALIDFALVGLMLQWRLQPEVVFALAALNPVQGARLALLSAAEPELSVLGPVGFFLANRLGSGVLLAIGIGWSLLLALTFWTLTLHRFRRGDLV